MEQLTTACVLVQLCTWERWLYRFVLMLCGIFCKQALANKSRSSKEALYLEQNVLLKWCSILIAAGLIPLLYIRTLTYQWSIFQIIKACEIFQFLQFIATIHLSTRHQSFVRIRTQQYDDKCGTEWSVECCPFSAWSPQLDFHVKPFSKHFLYRWSINIIKWHAYYNMQLGPAWFEHYLLLVLERVSFSCWEAVLWMTDYFISLWWLPVTRNVLSYLGLCASRNGPLSFFYRHPGNTCLILLQTRQYVAMFSNIKIDVLLLHAHYKVIKLKTCGLGCIVEQAFLIKVEDAIVVWCSCYAQLSLGR